MLEGIGVTGVGLVDGRRSEMFSTHSETVRFSTCKTHHASGSELLEDGDGLPDLLYSNFFKKDTCQTCARCMTRSLIFLDLYRALRRRIATTHNGVRGHEGAGAREEGEGKSELHGERVWMCVKVQKKIMNLPSKDDKGPRHPKTPEPHTPHASGTSGSIASSGNARVTAVRTSAL